MPPYQHSQCTSDICDRLLPSCVVDDGYEEWKQESSFEQGSLASFEAASTYSGFSKSRHTSRVPRGVYRPRSGLSARVRFILPVESYLSGDFEMLPPVQENKVASPSSWNTAVSSIFSKKKPPLDLESSTTPSSILRMDPASMPEETEETWMNVNHDEQEENEEYNGMILIVSPRGVELHKTCPVYRGDDFSCLDDEEEESYASANDNVVDGEDVSDDDSWEIPRDVAIATRSLGDEVSEMNDDYITLEAQAHAEDSLRRGPSSPRLPLLKLIRHMREKRKAFKVISKDGRELYAV